MGLLRKSLLCANAYAENVTMRYASTLVRVWVKNVGEDSTLSVEVMGASKNSQKMSAMKQVGRGQL